MKSPTHSFVRCICRILVISLVVGTAAVAQAAPKVFVASYGNDSNSGSPASPKRTFHAAHDAADAGGLVVVLEPAGYGALTIAKSWELRGPPGVNGFGTVPATGASLSPRATATSSP